MKRFELTNETKKINGHTLHRIKALIDMPMHCVRKGDLGGWIEKEENLQDDAWVFDSAMVFENAVVIGTAKVSNNAQIYGGARVSGSAGVYGNAKVYENAVVRGNAWVCGDAEVHGKAQVYENAWVCENAKVFGNARVSGNAQIDGYAQIGGNAIVKSIKDYIVFKNFWSSGRYFTWTKSNNMWKVGCFYGTGEELIKKAYQDSEESGMWYSRFVHFVEHIIKQDIAHSYEKRQKPRNVLNLLRQISESVERITAKAEKAIKLHRRFSSCLGSELTSTLSDLSEKLSLLDAFCPTSRR